MATIELLLTAQDYQQLPDHGNPTELVRGRVIEMNPPRPRHGKVCLLIGRWIGNFVEKHDLGHVMDNDTGVVTGRDPDTVRGADVAFYSYSRLPKGPLPDQYPSMAPDLVVEVRSPSDRWGMILTKVGEYLNAGVTVVCVLDPDSETAHVYYSDLPARTYTTADVLEFPTILAGFRVPVNTLFE